MNIDRQKQYSQLILDFYHELKEGVEQGISNPDKLLTHRKHNDKITTARMIFLFYCCSTGLKKKEISSLTDIHYNYVCLSVRSATYILRRHFSIHPDINDYLNSMNKIDLGERFKVTVDVILNELNTLSNSKENLTQVVRMNQTERFAHLKELN